MSVSDRYESACNGPVRAASFAEVLRELRARAGLSQNALARRAEVDPAYVNRLERPLRSPTGGTAGQPRRSVVLRLAAAARVGPQEADRLLAAAGHCPEAVARLGGWEPTLATVAELLAGPAAAAVRGAIIDLATAIDDPSPGSPEPAGAAPGPDSVPSREGRDV